MSYVDQFNTSQDSVFQVRVRVAMLTGATNVQSEDPGTANHANRSHYAQLVLNNPGVYLEVFAEAVITNAEITAERIADTLTDDSIQFTVNSLWNALAGVV